jgi:hypothetical protein
MRLVYLAAPVGADTQEGVDANLARALRWYRWACDTQRDCSFVMNWYVDIVVYPGADAGKFRDANADRQRGLARDDVMIRACDEYWMIAGRVSGGMGRGAHTARQAGRAVIDLTVLGAEPPDTPFHVAAPTAEKVVVGEVGEIYQGEF